MTTMVRNVARALCAANGDNPDGPVPDVYYPDDPDCIYPWAPYRKMARAAIEAMIAPSGYVMSEMMDQVSRWYEEEGEDQEIWERAIQAALKEEGQ